MPLANLNPNPSKPRQSPVCPSTVASQAGTSRFFHHFFSHSLEVLTSSSLNFRPFIFGFTLRPRGCFDWAFLWMTVSLLTHLSLSPWEPSQLLPSKSASQGERQTATWPGIQGEVLSPAALRSHGGEQNFSKALPACSLP